MLDINREVELLERCASECSLIAESATDRCAKCEHQALASEYREIAEALNAKDGSELREGFAIELYNMRGVHGYSAGDEERECCEARAHGHLLGIDWGLKATWLGISVYGLRGFKAVLFPRFPRSETPFGTHFCETAFPVPGRRETEFPVGTRETGKR